MAGDRRARVAREGFPFPALAAFAGRAEGGARDAALAAFVAARLALDVQRPRRAAPAARAERAAAARRWLAGLTLPAASRVPLARLADASAGTDRAAVAAALTNAIEALRPLLDAEGAGELEEVLRRVEASGE